MSFLDRFKIQPGHKSPDPAIRLASVPELGAEEGDDAVLVALATEDTDFRVRRAAAARINDVGVLARIAGSDPDATLREDLLGRLATIAASGESPEAAAQALSALTDQKQIGNVAKTSPVENVRSAAVGRDRKS